MGLVLLVGGARSGKSRLAVDLAWREAKPVVVIATAEARDDEMAERIELHRSQRPPEWTTVEEPIDLEGALRAAPVDAVVVLDCLTLWISNLMEHEVEIADVARRAAEIAAKRTELVVAVTNEVGSGIVPENSLGRRYRDALGDVNAIWASCAERTLLVVAGKVLPLRDGSA